MPTQFIAEVSSNHHRDLERCFDFIDTAARIGCDAVKFQLFKIDQLFAPEILAKSETHRKRKDWELPTAFLPELAKRSHDQGIQFSCTPFYLDAVAELEPHVDFYKIASYELLWDDLIRACARTGKPLIPSTGMATLGEIEAALEVLETAGTPRTQITVLHCNTEYPTPMEDVNLRAMCSIRDVFGVAVGYSDHTAGIEVPIVAVALGATVIEKHLTLDRNLPGPDHKASLEPDEFAAMVRAIRNIEQAMGDGIKRPSPSETKNKSIARKSLVAAKPICAGAQFTAENVTTKRPGNGMSSMRWDDVIGRTANRDFAKDEQISF